MTMKTMTKTGKPTRAYLGLIDAVQLGVLRLALANFKERKTVASQRELNRVSALIAGYQEDVACGGVVMPTVERFVRELRRGRRASIRGARGRSSRPRAQR